MLIRQFNAPSLKSFVRYVHQALSASRQSGIAAVPKTEVTSLQNGLKVVSENWSSSTCTVGLWIDVGSRYESDSNNGVSHFLEHMLFKGTNNRSLQAIELDVEKRGAMLNAYTSRESSVFYAKCLSKDLAWAVELLADCLKNPKLDAGIFEKQRTTILSELQSAESNYRDVVFDYLHGTAYQGTALGRTIIGTEETIKSMKPADLSHFMNTFFKAPKIVLCAAGDINHNELTDLASKHFGDISSQYGTEIPVRLPIRYTGSEIRDRDDAMPLLHAVFAVEGPGHANPDTLTLMVAACLNGSWNRTSGGAFNTASRLARTCYNEKAIHSFENFFTSYHDTSLWGIYLTAEHSGIEEGAWFFKEEWMRMCTSLTEFEVQRAKEALKTSLMLQYNGTTAICDEIGRHMLCYERRIPLPELMTTIDKITASTVRNVLLKYIYDRCPAVALLGPVEAFPDYLELRSYMWWFRY